MASTLLIDLFLEEKFLILNLCTFLGTPSNILYNIVWFRGGSNFAIAFDNDVICYHWDFKLAFFVGHNLSYQPSKFQYSRLSGSNVKKHPLPPVLYRDQKAQCF